ncbi:MAG: phosphoenolpyruvate carboxylase [Candidatus Woesearchaeota archaeon]|nr:phosphoenolpyruvate carboxylase [Candidatus Woesearchaeota archaeon]
MEPARVKSTQHPDNVYPAFFSESEIMGGNDEIKEAFYAFSHLGCHEQLWDAEGKETDNFVVKKLLTRYERYFKEHILGDRIVLSLRIPNPNVEKSEAKILLEALNSITRSYDIVKLFYGEDAKPPIIDVYVPMVQSADDVLKVHEYYQEYIINQQNKPIRKTTIKQWLGEFGPKNVLVTPLVEDKESILDAHNIARTLIEKTGNKTIRFWFARSDPALNYGSTTTALMLKVALQRLHNLEQELGATIYPIIGCGSAPFRGNFRPDNAEKMLEGYPSIQTFTIQSSFKYDHPIEEVQAAVKIINETKRSAPVPIDEAKILPIIEKLTNAYEEEIKLLAPLINKVAAHVPSRRLRKLHVGLFGYSRSSGGFTLPRAIKFTAALYSLGLPPELLSLSVLTSEEIGTIKEVYSNFEQDYQDAAQYFNMDNLHLFPELIQERIKETVRKFPVTPERKHAKITSIIAANLEKEQFDVVKEDIVRAGMIRKFLG